MNSLEMTLGGEGCHFVRGVVKNATVAADDVEKSFKDDSGGAAASGMDITLHLLDFPFAVCCRAGC